MGIQKKRRLIGGNIEWDQILSDPEIRAWIKAIAKMEKESALPPIMGEITMKEYYDAFKAAK